jgi:hypothetical protein
VRQLGQKSRQRFICFDNPHTDRDTGIRRALVDLVGIDLRGRQSAIPTQKTGCFADFAAPLTGPP